MSLATSSAGNWTVERGNDATLVLSASAIAARDDLAAALTSARARLAVGAVVAKRVSRDGRLIALGEFAVHPKGLHSIGRGLPATALRFPEEVDGALAGAAMFSNESVDGLQGPHGPLGLLEWCLEARLRGARVVAAPEATVAMDDAALSVAPDDVHRFIARFGFDPFAPDIDAIARRADLAPLRWNARFFGAALPFEKYAERGAFHWDAYASHAAFRQRADFLVALAADATAIGAGPVVDVGCGDGLFTKLLADRGRAVIGIDDDTTAIALATQRGARCERGSAYELPCADASACGALMFDVIEHLHNPTRALRELARVIAPGGALVISTPEAQFGASSDPTYHAFEFALDELTRLVEAAAPFRVESTARIGGPYRDLVLTARRM